MKVRDILQELRKDGWQIARQKGSHRQLKHQSKPGTVTVAGHESVELHPKTEASIRKQAGI